MLANGSGIQPRTVSEVQPQFDALLKAFNIPKHLDAATKLARLRAAPAHELVDACLYIPQHEFRHVTDGIFVSDNLFRSLDSGSWVQTFLEHGCELLIGECESEHFAFATWHTPELDTLDAVRNRLSVDYPAALIDKLCAYFCPSGELPTIGGHRCASWSEFFGILYAEIQVHATHRGFVNCLYEGGAASRVRRCRVGWRAKRSDKNFPPEMGATHGTDTALWFWGDGVGLELLRREEELAEEWCRPYWGWLEGKGFGEWRANADQKALRYIDGKGNTQEILDQDWERGIEVWQIIKNVQGSV